MPSICAVEGCSNQHKRNKPKISLFSFPKEEYYIKEWQKVCRNENINPKHGRICSAHFKPDNYREKSFVNQVLNTTPTHTRRLRRDAIPTENLAKKNVDIAARGIENGTLGFSGSTSDQSESDGILSAISALISSPLSEGNLENASEELTKLQIVIAEKLEELETKDFEDVENQERIDPDLTEIKNEDIDQITRLRQEIERSRKEIERLLKENKVLREQAEQRRLQMLEAKKQEAWWKKTCHIYKTRAEYAEAKLNLITSKNEELMRLYLLLENK